MNRAKPLLASFLVLLMCSLSFFAFSAEDSISEEEQQYITWAKGIWDSIDKQSGAIKIDEAGAILNVPEHFYFLNAGDTKKVLEDMWGNPPGSSVLGMLLPANVPPYENESWAVTIEYEEDGYVSDEDAGDIDYNELLVQMKADTRTESEARTQEGYEAIQLIGWASAPYYDSNQKKLHWAKEIKFGEQEVNTLNYSIRVLGRKGVLVLNFIAGMDQQSVIASNLDSVLALAEFDQGYKYSDFDPEFDQVAAYGLGALVAGKVIAKTGFLAVALVFLKKFGVFILLGLGVLVKKLLPSKKA